MAQAKKETPVKYCKQCLVKLERKRLSNGDLQSLLHFNKMIYCDINCMKKAFIEKPQKEIVAIRTSRARASELIPKGNCSICNKENAKDVHHKDENPLNNSLDNLQRLCRGCHTKLHRPDKVCSIENCGGKHKGHGYCEKHLQRVQKYGNPFMYKENQFTEIVILKK